MAFSGNLMEFEWELMAFNGNLMEFEWDLNGT
jgi:hypothetical protein